MKKVIFKFSSGNTAGFSYWLRFVSAGNWALTSSNFSQASLELSSDLGGVMLSQDVWFDKLIVDGEDKGLRAGTYLLTTLNDFFTGGHLGFSGSGAFHIGAVPESKHFANLMSLLVLFPTYLSPFLVQYNDIELNLSSQRFACSRYFKAVAN